MAWVEKDLTHHLVSTLCYVQVRQPADQAAQSHIQPLGTTHAIEYWQVQRKDNGASFWEQNFST